MPPRVQIRVAAAATVLLIAVFAMGVPARFFERGRSGAAGSGADNHYTIREIDALIEQASRAFMQGSYQSAVETFLKVPVGGSPRAVLARMQAGEILLNRLYDPTRGFAVLNELLIHYADQFEARMLLAQYLNACGRQFEADEHCREVVRLHSRPKTELLHLAKNPTGVGDVALLEDLRTHNPNDINVRLGLSLRELSSGNFDEAETALRRIVAEDPQLWTAQAGLATALIRQGQLSEYNAWKEALPKGAETSSEIWLARGEAAELHSRPQVAARCFIEAVRIDPDNTDACQGAARNLSKLGRAGDAQRFESRGALLVELAELAESDRFMNDAHQLERAIDITEKSGRLAEARAWVNYLGEVDPRRANDLARRLNSYGPITPEILQQLGANKNPANHVDLSGLPDV